MDICSRMTRCVFLLHFFEDRRRRKKKIITLRNESTHNQNDLRHSRGTYTPTQPIMYVTALPFWVDTKSDKTPYVRQHRDTHATTHNQDKVSKYPGTS